MNEEKAGLTVFILHCGNDSLHRPDKVRESFSLVDRTVLFKEVESGTSFYGLVGGQKWKMFIYSNERLSLSLNAVLPLYLDQETYTILSLFRVVNEDVRVVDDMVISISPRIFRSELLIRRDSLELCDLQRYAVNCTNILDGFLIGVTK